MMTTLFRDEEKERKEQESMMMIRKTINRIFINTKEMNRMNS